MTDAALVAAPTPRVPARARLGRLLDAQLAFWVVIALTLVVPILTFLSCALFPRLWGLDGGWVSVEAFRQATSGSFGRAVLDSVGLGVVVSVASTASSLVLAWIVHRTDTPGRRLVAGSVVGLLLVPSYLIAMGWQRLFEPMGVLDVLGVPTGGLRTLLYSPVGVALVLTVKGIPFAYLAISNALRALGPEFEEAARVHGGTARDAWRVVVALLAPAVWSSLAIVFAEAIGDYGVATTLAKASKFPVATFGIYNAVEAFPAQFGTAAAVSLILLGLVAVALSAQSLALRGRSYQTLGARSRSAQVDPLPAPLKALGTLTVVAFVVVALGVPAFGAISASLISDLGALGAHSVTLDNYQRALSSPELREPLVFSASMAFVVATVVVLMATLCARIMANSSGTPGARLLDLVLTGAVALPGIVFGAGYIFFFNLKPVNDLGLHLYGTTLLLGIAYAASSLPSTTRLLFGNMSQLRTSMLQASRVHGAGAVRTWFGILLPVLARPMLSAWLLAFAHVVLELPVSQLLYPAAHQPLAVGVQQTVDQYDFAGATAMQVLAILFSLAVMAVTTGLFRLLAPAGWRRIGSTA